MKRMIAVAVMTLGASAALVPVGAMAQTSAASAPVIATAQTPDPWQFNAGLYLYAPWLGLKVQLPSGVSSTANIGSGAAPD